MDKKVDMYYRFVWDTEPSDEQLLRLMEEVGEEVRQFNERIDAQLREQVRTECMKIKQREKATGEKA